MRVSDTRIQAEGHHAFTRSTFSQLKPSKLRWRCRVSSSCLLRGAALDTRPDQYYLILVSTQSLYVVYSSLCKNYRNPGNLSPVSLFFNLSGFSVPSVGHFVCELLTMTVRYFRSSELNNASEEKCSYIFVTAGIYDTWKAEYFGFLKRPET